MGWPDVSAHDLGTLAPGAIGVMLVGFAEGLGAAKTYASREHYDIDVNRELLGLGTANLGAGLSSGMVVNGSLSKTAVNGGAGAKTELSAIAAAVVTVITLLFLTSLFEKLPEATLAAIVIAAVIELVDFRSLAGFYRIAAGGMGAAAAVAARPDFVAAVAAMLGVLIFDTLPGLFIGIGASLLLLLFRASRPYVAHIGKVPGTPDQYGDMARHPENVSPEGVTILRFESGLFFANADWVRNRIRTAAHGEGVTGVVLDAESVPSIDVTAARMLAEVADELQRDGIGFVMARDVGQVRDILREADETDRPRMATTIPEAVAMASGTHER